MRISDWSSDVCSSDLRARFAAKLGVDEMPVARPAVAPVREQPEFPTVQMAALNTAPEPLTRPSPQSARLAYLIDRTSVVSGKSVSGRVYLGGRGIINKKKAITKHRDMYKSIKK